jgi:hypothetical protein
MSSMHQPEWCVVSTGGLEDGATVKALFFIRQYFVACIVWPAEVLCMLI